ncbi:MAG: protein kinase [Polyangiaceae bacterium]|nr:protein kinase [Polyangiaceae bacterium]
MAQNSEIGAFDRRHVSSGSGRSASRSPDSKAKTLGAPTPASDETLDTHSPPRRPAVAVAPTLLADPTAPVTPPSTPERLAALAASLPAVARESYQFGQEVAKGGIGRVVVARDQRLDRPVAIKELLVWNEKQEQRFVREALLTARLQHPAIVPIYEAGRWPDGEPFYAMKLVSGRSLADLVTERKTLPDRLSLLPHVIAAAQAIAFAHSKRIIHRDLKPANVLVGELGETVVIDWGLAKDLADTQTPDEGGAPVQSGEGLTLDGAVVGTPAYMPPEQATGKPVDERADVYALGALLYHVLSAVPPYHDVPWEKLLSTITERAPKEIEKLAPQISDELAAIVNKAMARDPARRYPTAKELATDLERFQTGQVVAAHAYTAKQVLVRYWKRNRGILTVGAAAVTLITLLVVATLVWTDKQRRFAEAKQREAEAASMAEADARASAQQSEKQATARADELTILQAHNALDNDPNRALAWLKTLSAEYTDAGEIRRIASDAYTRGVSRVFTGHREYINHIVVSPDGKSFATASDDKTIRLWDIESGKSIVFSGHTDEVWNVEFFPSGKELISCSKDRTSRIWNLEGKELARMNLPQSCRQLVPLPNGNVAGTAGMRGVPWLWHRSSGQLEHLTQDDNLTCSALSVDSGHVLTVSQSGNFVIRKPGSPEVTQIQGHPADYCRVGRSGRWVFGMGLNQTELWNTAGSPKRLAQFDSASRQSTLSKSEKYVIAGGDATVAVMNVETGEEVRRFKRHTGIVSAAGMSDDDQFAASASQDRSLYVWNIKTGETRQLSGFVSWVTDIKFLPNSNTVIASSAEGEVRLFSQSSAGKTLVDHKMRADAMAVSADGKIATVDEGGNLFVTSVTGDPVARHKVEAARVHHLAASSDRLHFAACAIALKLENDGWIVDDHAKGQTVYLGTFDGTPPRPVELPSPAVTLTAAAQTNTFFVGLRSGAIVRIAENGDVSKVAQLPHPVTQVRTNPANTLVAVGSASGDAVLIPLDGGEQRTLPGHTDRVWALTFLPDGKTLATGSADHTLRLWNLLDGTSKTFDEGGYGVTQIRHSKSQNILNFGNAGELKIRRLSLDSLTHLPPILPAHRGMITTMDHSKDGERLLTGALDGTVGVVDLNAAKARIVRASEGQILQVQFLPGDRAFVSLDAMGRLRIWPDDLPETVGELREWINKATDETIVDR